MLGISKFPDNAETDLPGPHMLKFIVQNRFYMLRKGLILLFIRQTCHLSDDGT